MRDGGLWGGRRFDQTKLVPALYNLAKDNLLPAGFAMVGVSFDNLSPEAFREQATQFLDKEDHSSEAWRWFNERLYYERGDFTNNDTYLWLSKRLSEIDARCGTQGNYLF